MALKQPKSVVPEDQFWVPAVLEAAEDCEAGGSLAGNEGVLRVRRHIRQRRL